MKKIFIMIIILIVTGEMTRAQELLPAGSALSGRIAAETNSTNAPKKTSSFESEEPNYWVAAKAHYNEWGGFDASQLTNVNYQATVKIEGTEATISGIVDLSAYYVTEEYDIKGVYDPEKKTVTISTPTYAENKDINEYTKVAKVNYYGDEMLIMLFSGNFEYIPSKDTYGLDTESELVFDVSDDLSTLTPRTGYGSYGFFTYDGMGKGFVNFFKTADWTEMTEKAHLIVNPEEVVFDASNVTVGTTVSCYFTLSNASTASTKYSVNVVGEGLRIYAGYDIDARETAVYKVELTPTQAGPYEGYAEFKAPNGSVARLSVKADVQPAPDFSSVVKNGDITFALDEDFPFVITDEITGFPVAAATNSKEDYGSSTLHALIDIPKGKVGTLSWKGISKSMSPNGASITMNGELIFYNLYNYNGIFGNDDLSNTVVLGEGINEIIFKNQVEMNWYLYGLCDEPLDMYLYDFDLQLQEIVADNAMLKDNEADFGRHYHDRFAVSDTMCVNMINMGKNPLKVTGFRGDEHFSGVVDGESAILTQNLPVRLLFTTDTEGTFEGDIIIETTAGEFTVHCKASAEKIIYDYSPIVREGEFSFNTSIDHPFNIDGNTATSSIAYCDMSNENPESWLDAWFNVPEGSEGKLSWEGQNSSADYFNFMDQKQHNDGTIITIDGKKVQDYAGEMDASSTTFDEADLIFRPGLHCVRFLYRKIYSDPEGLDRFKLKNLALTLRTDGINEIAADDSTVSTEIYDMSGKRVTNAGTGVYIVRRQHTNGTVSTEKAIR